MSPVPVMMIFDIEPAAPALAAVPPRTLWPMTTAPVMSPQTAPLATPAPPSTEPPTRRLEDQRTSSAAVDG